VRAGAQAHILPAMLDRLAGLLPFAAADRLIVQAARLQGVRSRRVQTPRGPGHVLELKGEGPGPPVVLLHGLGSMGADYLLLMQSLAAHHRRVLAPDLPGHGEAPPPVGGMVQQAVLPALIAHLDAVLDEPALVFGNSLGGLAAIRFAQARPHRVRALALASPGGAPLPAAELRVLLDGFDLHDTDGAEAFVDRFLGPISPLRPLAPLIARGVQARMARPGPAALIQNAHADALLTEDDLRGLAMPTWIFWGDADRVLPPACAAFFAAHLPPRGVFERGVGFGHATYLDDLGAFSRRLRSFGGAYAGD